MTWTRLINALDKWMYDRYPRGYQVYITNAEPQLTIVGWISNRINFYAGCSYNGFMLQICIHELRALQEQQANDTTLTPSFPGSEMSLLPLSCFFNPFMPVVQAIDSWCNQLTPSGLTHSSPGLIHSLTWFNTFTPWFNLFTPLV